MGQRHQVFIRVLNPAKVLKNHIKSGDKKKYSTMFGTGEYTVLAFHHQWLYGMSAVFNLASVLNFAKSITNKKNHRNIFSENIMSYEFGTPERFVQSVQSIMELITDTKHPRGVGFERFTFLNPTEPYMREFYTNGDNNDGVTIIDLETMKYCFMNIGGDSTIEMAPRHKPISAEEYAHLYYPHTEEEAQKKFKSQEYTQEDKERYFLKGKTMYEVLTQNKKECKYGLDKVKKFEVLTKAEVDKMFPKVAKELKKETIS